MGFGEALSALMTERDISGRSLARQVPCDQALICRYRSGKQKPSAKMAARLDEVLDAGGSLVALAKDTPLGRRAVLAVAVAGLAGPPLFGVLDLDGRERLAWARRHPSQVDDSTVESLAGVLAAQRRAEDAIGSAAMIRSVQAQLDVVDDLLSGARGSARPAVVEIAQQWAQFAAWLHISARDFPAARVLCRQALELAIEADDATMTTTILRLRGYMAWLAGEPGAAIGLAQAAQRDTRAAASERAYGASLEACAHAMTGNETAAERKLSEMRDLAAQMSSAPERERPWSYWYTPQWFECQRGLALGYLAHNDRHRALAIEALAAGYAGLGPDAAHSEWGADYLVHRAAIHARGGDVAQACADAMQAAPLAEQMNSASLRGLLIQLHAGLAARWPDDTRVAELADAVA